MKYFKKCIFIFLCLMIFSCAESDQFRGVWLDLENTKSGLLEIKKAKKEKNYIVSYKGKPYSGHTKENRLYFKINEVSFEALLDENSNLVINGVTKEKIGETIDEMLKPVTIGNNFWSSSCVNIPFKRSIVSEESSIRYYLYYDAQKINDLFKHWGWYIPSQNYFLNRNEEEETLPNSEKTNNVVLSKVDYGKYFIYRDSLHSIMYENQTIYRLWTSRFRDRERITTFKNRPSNPDNFSPSRSKIDNYDQYMFPVILKKERDN